MGVYPFKICHYKNAKSFSHKNSFDKLLSILILFNFKNKVNLFIQNKIKLKLTYYYYSLSSF